MKPQRASGRKQAERLRKLARERRMLNLKKNGEALIPQDVLKKIAELRLPPNPWVYNLVLRELLSAGK